MLDYLDSLASLVADRIRAFGYRQPSTPTLSALLRAAYLASLRTEEGRFIRTNITYANPRNPQEGLPRRVRADYPRFFPLADPQELTPPNIVKLGRAIDHWSAAIAVWGASPKTLRAWGVVDQAAQTSARLHRASNSGFGQQGILTITVGGVAELSVYHRDVFLGGIRADVLVKSHAHAIDSESVRDRIAPHLSRPGLAIASALGIDDVADVTAEYFYHWSDTVARICIGLRRLGTGGAILITPRGRADALHISVPFAYRRLGEALALRVLDDHYRELLLQQRLDLFDEPSLPQKLCIELAFAEGDAEDRADEVDGAAKLVTSLAAVDGLLLMTPELFVRGFGVKIGPGAAVPTVFDSPHFVRRGKAARTVDVSRYGTRHSSMLRYCAQDPEAVGIVVSQDGTVRLIMSFDGSVALWDNVKLMGDMAFSAAAVRAEREYRAQQKAEPYRPELGFTAMPKTYAALMRHARSPTPTSGRRKRARKAPAGDA